MQIFYCPNIFCLTILRKFNLFKYYTNICNNYDGKLFYNITPKQKLIMVNFIFSHFFSVKNNGQN